MKYFILINLILISNISFAFQTEFKVFNSGQSISAEAFNNNLKYLNDIKKFSNQTEINFQYYTQGMSINRENLNINFAIENNILSPAIQTGTVISSDLINQQFLSLKSNFLSSSNNTLIFDSILSTTDLDINGFIFVGNNKSLESLNSQVSCLRGEVCSLTLSDYGNGSGYIKDLIKVTKEDDSIETISLSVNDYGPTSYAPYRTGDYGCYDAPYGSRSDKNIFCCDGSGTTCTRYCYNGSCYGSPLEAFNKFNSENDNKYKYKTWGKTTGDLRSGCQGNYVYGFRVQYYKKQFSLKKQ